MLADPAFNVEYGQSYLEMLRDSPHTQGLLPKVIAAYNAGPGSVQKWNAGGLKDNGDVLLFIESIPFRETRHYVEVVLRNYWLYQMKEAAGAPQRASARPQSIAAIANNQWPRFPTTQAVAR
jgi:soluble lytic murein transglycosylase-like protein